MLAKELLESIKEFRVDDELPFGTVDYMNIDTAIAELAALEAVAEAAREVEQWLGGGSTKNIADLQVELLGALNKIADLQVELLGALDKLAELKEAGKS